MPDRSRAQESAMTVNRVIIEAPPSTRPVRFGLASVADIKDAGDPHVLGGFSYERQCGHGTGFAVDPCTGASVLTKGGAGPYPVDLTIDSDIPGTYVIVWGDGTGNGTATNTGAPTLTAHSYAAVTPRTITITGPTGYGTRTVGVTPGPAATTYSANPAKTAQPGLATVNGDRAAVYALHRCRMPGITRVEAQARAVNALNASEGNAIEDLLYDRYLASATDIGGAATTATKALAILENYAAVNYAYEPTIHMDRFLASTLSATNVIEVHGTRLETKLGAGVAAGTGYSAHPVPATSYIFATGLVVIRKGKSEVRGAPKMAPADNEETWLAERPLTMGVECFTVKVAVTT
jgi:hypothetical protein